MNIKQRTHTYFALLPILSFVFLSACGGGNQKNSDDMNSTPDNSLDTGLVFSETNNTSGILLKFRSNVIYDIQQTILKDAGLIEVKNYGVLPGLIYARSVDNSPTSEVLKRLETQSDIIYAEPDYNIYITAMASNSTPVKSENGVSETQNSGLSDLDATLNIASAETELETRVISESKSAPTTIAILDTGIDFSQQDLKQYMWVNSAEIAFNGIDDDHNGWIDDVNGWNFVGNNSNATDENNHGTKIAGIVAGNLKNESVPVPVNVKLVSLKVLDKNGRGKISSILGAFDYIAKNKISISNNSWMTKIDSKALKDVLQSVSGHLLIVAAGDNSSNIDSTFSYPSSYLLSNSITVSAADESGKLADFSNYGMDAVNLLAPGLLVERDSVNNSYANISGTSVAAAVVSGAVVRVKDSHDSFSPQEVKNWLIANLEKEEDLKNINSTSSRLQNIEEIIALLSTENTVPVSPSIPSSSTSNVLTIEPASLNQVALNQRHTISAVGGVAPYTWSVSDDTVARINVNPISDSVIELQPLKTGLITLTLQDSMGNLIAVENIEINIPLLNVTPSAIVLNIGQSIDLEVTGGTSPYRYASLDETVAMISSDGFVTALREGSVNISITDAEGQMNVATITVGPNLYIDVQREIIAVDGTMKIIVGASTGSLTWASSDSSVLAVDEYGEIVAKRAGKVKVSVMDEEGRTGNVILEVRDIKILAAVSDSLFAPASEASTIIVGGELQLKATGGSTPYLWSIDNNEVASIDSNGLLNAISPGLVKVSVLDANGFSDTFEISLTPSVLSVNQTNVVMTTGDNVQLIASGGDGTYT
ncbi:MAG: S8 family serine peptidase, partial [Gammaproteobacteria bacterium]|nr:S8 family serine peptidase [Gammaproteobacteria bacterium]